ncbi:MAG TPA: hypothetical protein VFQ65_27975 [Kofleriaceae bacterium]|nr:hypothetical protein [Kofleriaceae bacterium]
MRARGFVLVLLLVGCQAHLGGQAVGGNDDVDANGGGGGGGGGGSGSGSNAGGLDAGSGAAACASGRVVFLEFEGATLTQAATSDATANKAVWLGVGSATMPQFRPGASDRATQIADTVADIKTARSGFPDIQVVTTRPAAGPYFMIGFGGAHQTVNVPYTGAVNRLDCGDTATKNDLAYVFESVSSPQVAANLAVGALLFGLGATGTTNPNDCMCGWLTNCQANTSACTISTNITAASGCNVPNPVDETTFLGKFCN